MKPFYIISHAFFNNGFLVTFMWLSTYVVWTECFLSTGKDESGNHSLQEKLEKCLILMTKVVSSVGGIIKFWKFRNKQTTKNCVT